VLIVCVVVGLPFAPQGFVSKTIYRRLGSWLQQHLCGSAFGTYGVTGLVLGAAMILALLVPTWPRAFGFGTACSWCARKPMTCPAASRCSTRS
jgi:hypothetical protein